MCDLENFKLLSIGNDNLAAKVSEWLEKNSYIAINGNKELSFDVSYNQGIIRFGDAFDDVAIMKCNPSDVGVFLANADLDLIPRWWVTQQVRCVIQQHLHTLGNRLGCLK